MITIRLYWLLSFILVVLVGCVTTEAPQDSNALSASETYTPQTAIVTVGNLKGVLDSDTTLSWFEKDLIDLSDSQLLTPEQANEVHLFLKRRIQEEFVKKGVKFSSAPGSTRYQVLVAGAGTTQSTENLHALFKIYPGLGNNDLTRGAVMVSVLDTARNFPVWRGVAEGIVHDQLSFEERIARIDGVVMGLMSRVEL